jgi:hypothetical protein
VSAQVAAARAAPAGAARTLVGAGFTRAPAGSTAAYTAWANALTPERLLLEQWRECTLVQPTWLLARDLFDAVGGFDEVWQPPPPLSAAGILAARPRRLPRPRDDGGRACAAHANAAFPEDTLFFHRHLARGGALARVPQPLVEYSYAPASQSWRMPRALLLEVRVALFEERVLGLRGAAADGPWPPGSRFTIWGAGRDGKAFFKALSAQGQARVRNFCDIDAGKVGHAYPPPPGKRRRTDGAADAAPASVPIIHWRDVVPPAVICVATGGDRADDVRRNVRDAGLVDGDTALFFV